MKQVLLGVLASAWSISPVWAVDHNNVDANRPLDFDDAETIAYREKSFEFGGAFVKPKGGKTGLEGEAEFLYGFKKNWHLNAGFEPKFVDDGTGRRSGDIGDLSLGVQHNFNREIGNTPAFGVRADAFLPTGRGSRGVDFRLRGIASKSFRQYARLHLNLDLQVDNSPAAGDRKTQPGVILGYSQPLGYPTRFDRTLLAQVGYRANPLKGQSGITKIGVGLRQQVTPQSVFDVGLVSEVSGGAGREAFKLVAGYSTAF
jgi:hypothetical protein